jgi:hypothetical protein
MSEWIDVLVYASQIFLFWVFLPRQGKSFTRAMIADRNASWASAHPEIVLRLERSSWLINTYYAYAAASVAWLLLITLGVVSPLRTDVPKWEVLKDLHGTLMLVGVLGWLLALLAWTRWLAKHVPLATTRRATLRPRLVSDYVSRAWRVVVEVLTALHLSLWLTVPAFGITVDRAYWGRFAFIAAVTMLFAAIAALTPRRRPGYADRIFGEAYRRAELKVAYILRVTPLIAGAMMLGERVLDLEVDRVGHLILTCVISTILLVFLRLRPVATADGAVSGAVTG